MPSKNGNAPLIILISTVLSSIALATPPQALAVMPFAGSGTSQAFTFTFSDSSGWAAVSVVDIVVNSYFNGVGACYFAFVPSGSSSGSFYLVDDADGGYAPGSPMSLSSGGSLQNSQCVVNATGSSFSASGPSLTLTVSITFKSAFVGNKLVYAAAQDAGGNSGWQALGAWTITPVPVTPIQVAAVSPLRGPFSATFIPGGGALMQLTFTNVNGWGNTPILDVLINDYLDGDHACYFAFVPTGSSSGYFDLVADLVAGGYATGSPMYTGSSGTTQNSQCTVSASGSSVSISGNTLTLTVNLTFPAAFIGNKGVYVAGRDNLNNSGWQGLSTWSVGGPPHVSTDLTDFIACIGSSGTAQTCMLSPARYPVPVPAPGETVGLKIGRSNIIITGGGGPGDTILYRGDPSLAYIMRPSTAVTNVTISNLTFDGNRYGFGTGPTGGISCLGPGPPNPGYWDLDTSGGGALTVEWSDFNNAPDTAVLLGGAGSTVSLSNFGNGGAGIGANGSYNSMEPAAESATRATAVYVTDGTGAWYNNISYAGTAGITLNGDRQVAYGNWLFNNRYELSDGHGGGQLTLNGPSPTSPVQSSNSVVAGNVTNGNLWPQVPTPSTVNGCAMPTGQTNNGLEVYGFGHVLYNNEAYNHTGAGMIFTGGCQGSNTNPLVPPYPCPVGQITISGVNYLDTSDSPKFVEGNKGGGIVFRSGPNTFMGPYGSATGVTLDNLLVYNNAFYGVALEGVTNDTAHNNPIPVALNSAGGGPYVGFINSTCMVGNTNNTIPSSWSAPLAHPLPLGSTPYSFYYPPYDGGACPTNNQSNAAPAPSNIPGWFWGPIP